MDAVSLLKKLQTGGHLDECEIASVRRALSADPTQDRYTLIHVLWKASDLQSFHLIKQHLIDTDDMVRRIALQTLVDLFPSDDTFDISYRMTHDQSPYVRMVAVVALGGLGASLPHRTSDAVRLLLEGFERLLRDHDQEWEYYYEGLLNVTGAPMIDRPSSTRDMSVGDVRSDVISAARRLRNL